MKKIAILLGMVASSLVLTSCAHQSTQPVGDNVGAYSQNDNHHPMHRDYKGEQE